MNKEQIEQIMKMNEEERKNLLSMLQSMGVDTSVLYLEKRLKRRQSACNPVGVVSESESESETISCIACDTEFEYVRKRGAKPRYCGDDCKPTYVNKSRTYTCNKCDGEFEMHGRGKLRLTCEPCALLPTVRTYTCDVCGEIGEQEGKGSLRKRHVDCKLVPVAIVRTYTCDVCGKEGEQHGIGKSRKRCDGCKLVIKKIRTYQCVECNDTFEMHGRGKLRKRCLNCKPAPSSKQTIEPNTTVNTPKTEEEDSVESNDVVVDEHSQLVMDIMRNLGIGN